MVPLIWPAKYRPLTSLVSSDAVLARPGLGDEALLAHALDQQRLAQHVVDLVRPGVVEVLALEEDPHRARVAAGVRGEARHLGQRAGAAGVLPVQALQLGRERGVLGRLAELGLHTYFNPGETILWISDSGKEMFHSNMHFIAIKHEGFGSKYINCCNYEPSITFPNAIISIILFGRW